MGLTKKNAVKVALSGAFLVRKSVGTSWVVGDLIWATRSGIAGPRKKAKWAPLGIAIEYSKADSASGKITLAPGLAKHGMP